jgi:predicted pyridoxine 5'-phosphate oxidase superfamily flavin-nucleotide-binding protein
MYRAAMPHGVQHFLSEQRLAVLSTLDKDGRVWASMRTGPPGFLHALDERTVEVAGTSHPEDPLLPNLAAPANAGMLVIHLATRHRVRVNGTAQLQPDGRIRLSTEQVYGNCPQYIQARNILGEQKRTVGPARFGHELDEKAQGWIGSTDTLFIATAHAQSGADASHRGGKPGFVRVENPKRLLIPDYAGNNMFNTLGNIESYPHAGLLFPDFESGDVLQLSGSARILWDDARIGAFKGAQRLIEFDIERVVELPQAIPLRFEFQDYSPVLP